MLEKLSRKWSRKVIKDKRSLSTCIFLVLAGLVFLGLYFSGIVSHASVLVLGAVNLVAAFQHFERYGLLRLIDEIEQERNPSHPSS
ncbi:MAG: hypothetical protein ACXIUB_01285 [Wenzhouxiangella sp.]